VFFLCVLSGCQNKQRLFPYALLTDWFLWPKPQSAYCTVRTESLNTRHTSLSGRAMAHAVSCRPHTAKARLQSQARPPEVCGGKTGNGAGFSPSTSVFPCQHYYNKALYSSSWSCCFQKDKRANHGSLQKAMLCRKPVSAGYEIFRLVCKSWMKHGETKHDEKRE
jgi:hypothetical protein